MSPRDLRTSTAGTRGARVGLVVDGRPLDAYEGESVAAALLASGLRALRFTDRDESPRSYYCGMGVCHDCLVTVDGVPYVRACMTPVRDGMRVERLLNLEGPDMAPQTPQRSSRPGKPGALLVSGARTEVAVVGGGPAGMAAAVAAAEAGARVTLVDENPRLGGQYWRQPPPTVGAAELAHRGSGGADRGHALMDRVRSAGVELRLDTSVWGIFPERTLALVRGDAVDRLEAQAIVFATGAHDRPVPFPGWTLPGVVTAGGAQNLMKGYGVLPGRRVLVAGSGPLLLVVAHYLLAGGAQVAAVAEAASMRSMWRWGPRLLPYAGFLREGLGYLAELRRARVELLRGHVIRRALGETEVTGAVVSACDEAWLPRAGTERRLDVDAIVVGYGFVPSDLARLAGCEYRWVPDVGGWVPVVGHAQSTSVPGIFVAGEAAGVAGAVVAVEEGTLAGLGSARHLGRLDEVRFRTLAAPVERRLRRLAGFRRVMDEVYRAGPGLVALAEPDTIVCRCEEIAGATVRDAIEDGARLVNEVKISTRAGMGRCQGRLCGPTVAAMIAQATGGSPAAAGTYTTRVPVKPVTFAALAGALTPAEQPGSAGVRSAGGMGGPSRPPIIKEDTR